MTFMFQRSQPINKRSQINKIKSNEQLIGLRRNSSTAELRVNSDCLGKILGFNECFKIFNKNTNCTYIQFMKHL